MKPIQIPGIGEVPVEQILGTILSILTLIGVVTGVVVGVGEKGSSNNDVSATSTARPASKPTSSAKPNPAPTSTPVSTETKTTVPPTPTTSPSTSVSTEPTPQPTTTIGTPTETTPPESQFGPGKKYSWRYLFNLNDRLMKIRADQLDIGMDRFILRGGGWPRVTLENYIIGEANKYKELIFDEEAENAEHYSVLHYFDENADERTLVIVHRISIPLVEKLDGSPWENVQAPDYSNRITGTAVRYDDNYFYIFTAVRNSDMPI